MTQAHTVMGPQPKSLRSVIAERDTDGGRRTIATGFDVLDRTLGGGVRTRDLVLVGGTPGIGKTILSLQWARNAALRGETVVYVCYEHDERSLFLRLLLAELGVDGSLSVEEARAARTVLRSVSNGARELEDVLGDSPGIQDAHRRVTEYSDRIWLVRASGTYTDLPAIGSMVHEHQASMVVIDYLQKVPIDRDGVTETERITIVTQGLKEMAMEENVAVIAIAAADRAGLDSPRLRLRHLRGSSAMAYEADAILILNEKYQIVSKSHVAYDLTTAEGYKSQVVFSVEKNREGSANVDLEFSKEFEFSRFRSTGRLVNERLFDERLDAI